MRIKQVNLDSGVDEVVMHVYANDGYLCFSITEREPRMYLTLWLTDLERDHLRRLLEPKTPVDPSPLFSDKRTK